jgi:hypothetical protein
MLSHKQLWKKTPNTFHLKYCADIRDDDDKIWRDVYSDEENDEYEIAQIYKKQKYKDISFTPIRMYEPIKKKSISFDTIVKVILIPESKEYHDMRDLLWYNEKELHQFVMNEIEIRKEEREKQEKELHNMRNEEIYTIMLS